MMRKALATLAAVLLIGTAAADTYKCTVPTDQVLNVRVQPSKKAATDGRRLFRGDTVDGTILAGGKWISYKDDGVTVYASSQYMELVLDVDCYVVGDGRLRWRKSPGGKVGGYYKPGDAVTCYGIAHDKDGGRWAKIGTSKYDKNPRYVSLDYLQDDNGDCLADLYVEVSK